MCTKIISNFSHSTLGNGPQMFLQAQRHAYINWGTVPSGNLRTYEKKVVNYKRAKESHRKAILAKDKLFIDGKLYCDDGPVQMKSTLTKPKNSGGREQKHGRGK